MISSNHSVLWSSSSGCWLRWLTTPLRQFSIMNNVKQSPSVRCKKQLLVEHAERRSLKLWRTPLKTAYYFLLECFYQFVSLIRSVLRYKFATCLSILTLIMFFSLRSMGGSHQEVPMLMCKFICRDSFMWKKELFGIVGGFFWGSCLHVALARGCTHSCYILWDTLSYLIYW